MKAKRIVAWLLVCVLQLGICLLIPLHGRMREQQMEREGESYRFALHSVQCSRNGSGSTVNVEFPQELPGEGDWLGATVRVLETGEDGLARIRETFVTQEQIRQYPDIPLFNQYGIEASVSVSGSVRRDLDRLKELMDELQYQIRSSAGIAPEEAPAFNAARYLQTADQIDNAALRALAKRQIDAMNGEDLFDSYVTGVLYEGEIILLDVYVAGIHVATIHN